MTTLLETTKQLILVSFMALPLMLICYTFFMGFGLGNPGLIILLAGQILLVPAAVMLYQFVSSNGGPGLLVILSIFIMSMVLISFYG